MLYRIQRPCILGCPGPVHFGGCAIIQVRPMSLLVLFFDGANPWLARITPGGPQLNFASLQFAGFLSVLFILYWLTPSFRLQNVLVLAASYYFYACWDVKFLFLIVLVTAAGFWAGEFMLRHADDSKLKRRALLMFLVFNLSILGVFKYFDFFSSSLTLLLNGLGFSIHPLLLKLVLPAAISFYTFESISYVVGAFKNELKVRPNWLEYALFIGFFPKLVAGPIERPNVLIPQLAQARTLTWQLFSRGLFLILLGLCKKVAIADGLAPYVDATFDAPGDHATSDVLLATVAFAFQIYGDFSGYSDIARGAAMLFGIELSLNFNFPYFSKDPSEFWRRWHISLSSWLRDYVYIPLGGNRASEARTYRNLMATMLVGGLWHGAAWTFIAWGAYHGAMLAVHKALAPVLAAFSQSRHAMVSRLYPALSLLVFFVLTCYGWLLFRAHSFEQVSSMTQALWAWRPATAALPPPPLSALLGVPLLLIHDWFGHRSAGGFMHEQWPAFCRAGLYAALFTLILMGVANSRSAFIYFQF